MDIFLVFILIVAVLVVNPLITKRLITNVPNVWDGGFEIILSDNQTISGSFQNDYGINGIDIPKGKLIWELVIKQVPKGFVPMVNTGRAIETRLVTDIYDFPQNAKIVDLHFEVTNPETLPDLFSFSVASDRRIARGEQRDGLFFPKHDIHIWYNRAGAES